MQRHLVKHDDRLTKLDGQYSKVDNEVCTQRRELTLLQNTELLVRAGDTGVLQRKGINKKHQVWHTLVTQVHKVWYTEVIKAHTYNINDHIEDVWKP